MYSTTRLADLVLPAAAWGEKNDFSSTANAVSEASPK